MTHAASATSAAQPRPRRGYLVPGLIALVVLAAIAVVVNFVGLQSRTPRTLAGSEAATLISQQLQAAHQEATPPDVTCPASEPLRAGVVFRCVLHRTGQPPVGLRVTELAGGTLSVRQLAPSGT